MISKHMSSSETWQTSCGDQWSGYRLNLMFYLGHRSAREVRGSTPVGAEDSVRDSR